MKLAKLSLAAIMAAGVFSVANATPLEDAIKGVDVSGYVRYRFYNEDNNVAGHKTDRHRFTVPVLVKIPASDQLTVAVGGFAQTNDYATDGQGSTGANYTNSSFTLDRMYFNYANAGFNVRLGKDLINTPVTEGGITGSYGDQAVVSYSGVKDWTFAAAAVVKSNQYSDNGVVGAVMDANTNIYALAAIGKVGPVNAQLWAFSVSHVLDSLYFLQLSGSFSGLSLKGQAVIGNMADEAYATAKTAGLVKDDTSAFYGIQAGYKVDNFKVGAGYTTTDSDNGITTLDTDGSYIKAGHQIYYKTANTRDTDLYFLTAGAGFGQYSVNAGYAGSNSVSGTTIDGANEWWLGAGYAYNKKMKVSAYYSALNMDGVDDTVAGGDNNEFRVEVKYSF